MTHIGFFKRGFRPFFLLAALWSGFALPLWLLAYRGNVALPSSLDASAWHGHELVFGYAAAALAGFLLTAIPNWTGRSPLAGPRLVVLVALWAFGRAAMLVVDTIGIAASALLDLSFLAALAAIALREIVAGKNWRNLKILLPVGLLFTANVWFHANLAKGLETSQPLHLAIAALLALITLIGGRVIPNFTRNWLVTQGSERFPASFGALDKLTIAVTFLALGIWVASPEEPETGIAGVLAGLLHVMRLSRWRGFATWSEPLVLILHVAYAFLPLGFLALAMTLLFPGNIPASLPLHVWTVGAVGTMTLAVMTRATLGHSGCTLTAGPATVCIYTAVLLATLLRIAAPFCGAFTNLLLQAAGLAWAAAFLGFAMFYGRLLICTKAAS